MDILDIETINKSLGIKVFCKGNRGTFTAVIASEVHPITHVVGLDLQDNFPITYLAHINQIEIIN